MAQCIWHLTKTDDLKSLPFFDLTLSITKTKIRHVILTGGFFVFILKKLTSGIYTRIKYIIFVVCWLAYYKAYYKNRAITSDNERL